MTTIDQLVPDIYRLFEGKELSEHLDHFSNELSVLMTKRFSRYGSQWSPSLTMSSIGRPLRQLWYDLKGYKGDEATPEMLFKYLYGDLLECLLIFLAREAGHKIEFLQEKVELDGVKGRIDLCIDDFLIDVKSCSSASYTKFVKRTVETDDPFGYMGQLSGYTCALVEAHYPIKGAGFLAVDKQLGKLCTCLFTIEEMLEYGPRARIAKIKESLEKTTPPERCYPAVPLSKKDPDGPMVLGVGCSYCRHHSECWKDANGGQGLIRADYSFGPRWFTDTKKHKFRKETTIDKFPVKK